jgi:peptidoglycan-associated lipoprotein
MKPRHTSASTIALAILGMLPLASGCSHQMTTPTSTTTTTSSELAPASPGKENSSIYLSERLRSACGIKTIGSTQDAPKFAFDRSEILPEDQDVLAAVAQCVTVGPLKGRSIMLVGRADPRGTEEYNMALGERRSNSVDNYLGQLGVSPSQMTETSRGSLDATGNDEATWRTDRRVDIDILGQP